MTELLGCTELRLKGGDELGSIFLLTDSEQGIGIQAFANEEDVFSLGFGSADPALEMAAEMYRALANCFKQTLKDVFETVGICNHEILAEQFHALLCERIGGTLPDATDIKSNHKRAARLFTEFLMKWSEIDVDVLPAQFECEVSDLSEDEGLTLADLEGNFLKTTPIKTDFDQEICSMLLYEPDDEEIYSVMIESEGKILSTLSFDQEEPAGTVAYNLHQALVNCAQETCNDIYKSVDEPDESLENCFWTLLFNRVKNKLVNEDCCGCNERAQCHNPEKRLLEFIQEWSPGNMELLMSNNSNFSC